MAKLPKGIFGPMIGKLGNLTGYMNGDTNVVRTIGDAGPPSVPQQGNLSKMSLISPLLVAVQSYVELGFKNTKKPKSGWTAYSQALSINLLNGTKGEHLKKEIAYEHLSFSAGDLPQPKNTKVKITGNILEFTWDADMQTDGVDKSDQVMLIAYFPDTIQAITLLSGARRTEEKQLLELPSFTGRTVIETYLSFINDDRTEASKSVYAGQVIWE